MTDSILTSTKKILGIDEAYTAFDLDVMTHINSVFFTLDQLGVGPQGGFSIEDASAEWPEFIGSDQNLNAVKSYMYLRVRLLFDPPQTSYLIEALDKQRQEMEWRLNVYREETAWVPPGIPVPGTLTRWYDLTGGIDFPSSAPEGSFGYDTTDDKVYVKSSGSTTFQGYWWNLTGGLDFPPEAAVGDYGFDSTTGQVWRKA